MARRSSNNTISLFPFLAVLVCTMGALILLLLVTTRRLRDDQGGQVADVAPNNTGDSADDTKTPSPFASSQWEMSPVDDFVITPEVRQPSTNHEFSVALLPPTKSKESEEDLVARRKQLKDLQERADQEVARQNQLRQRIAAANEQLKQSEFGSTNYDAQLAELNAMRQQERRLGEELKAQQQFLVQLKSELDEQSKLTDDGEQLLHRRESALITLREIAKDKTSAASVGTDQTTIEFTNTDGTKRTPVIVNVTAAGFEFLPTGVKISMDDMEGFPNSDNPLLSGILAVHDARNSQSVTSRPYVLLLVRPDGSMPFYAAQRSLSKASIHFGYELMEEGRRVAAGNSSATEQTALQQALLSA